VREQLRELERVAAAGFRIDGAAATASVVGENRIEPPHGTLEQGRTGRRTDGPMKHRSGHCKHRRQRLCVVSVKRAAVEVALVVSGMIKIKKKKKEKKKKEKKKKKKKKNKKKGNEQMDADEETPD
jgi:hypothetical protein